MFNGGNSIMKYINNMKMVELENESDSLKIQKKRVQYDIFTDGSEIKEKGTKKSTSNNKKVKT